MYSSVYQSHMRPLTYNSLTNYWLNFLKIQLFFLLIRVISSVLKQFYSKFPFVLHDIKLPKFHFDGRLLKNIQLRHNIL